MLCELATKHHIACFVTTEKDAVRLTQEQRARLGKVAPLFAPALTVRLQEPEAALAALEEQKPDLVMLDFNMPGRDGLDLAAQLRRLRPTMPVAVISANHQQEIIDRANAVGATFLSKPLTEPALRNFIEGAERQIRAARHD